MTVVSKLVHLGPAEGLSGIPSRAALIVQAMRQRVVSTYRHTSCRTALNGKQQSVVTLRASHIEPADIGDVCRGFRSHKTQASPLLSICSCRTCGSCRYKGQPLRPADAVDRNSREVNCGIEIGFGPDMRCLRSQIA